jgi:integrase/recombinase XerC
LPNEKIKSYRDTSGVGIEQMQKAINIPNLKTLKGKRDYTILLLLWENGLRRSEVINTNLNDFNKEEKTLNILGKGKGSQKEIVYLSDKTTKAIDDYINLRNSYQTPLFLNVDRAIKGNGRLTSQAIYYIVRDIFKKAGITKPMSPHRIRHSAITAALDITGGNVRSVQRFSRHAKLETLQIYDDNRKKFQAEVTSLLSEAIENDIDGKTG